ncbi:MAG: ATP-binding protein [Candidatus Eisenbacteria bacterium]|nr:ATP-binding protein [Candidatus Eisenbacteria bacterium]
MHARRGNSGWGTVRGSRAICVWGFTSAAVVMLIMAGMRMDSLAWGAVGIMSALGIATSLFSFKVDERTTVTFGPAVFMGSIALFGALAAVWVAAVSCVVLELVRFRRSGPAGLARIGIRVIAVLAASGVYMTMGGVVDPVGLSLVDAGRFVVMFAAYAVITGVLEASLEDMGSDRFRRYVRWFSGRGVVVELAMLPLSLLLVSSYIPGEPATFPLLTVVIIISSAAGQKLWETQQTLLDRVSELKTLNSVGDALTCAVRLDDLVKLIHEHAGNELSTPALSIALYDTEKDALEFRVCVLDDCDIALRTAASGGSFTGWVVANREVLYIPDLRKETERALAPPLAECTEARDLEVRSWLGVPIVAEDSLLGVLSIMSDHPRAFDESASELLATIGTQVGKVVVTARLYERLEKAQRTTQSWGKELEQKVDERTRELREAREELESLNEGLEQRVEDRTQELRDVQARIVQSGRLAAVGELAAGVAHELNNPLAGILGYAQYDLERLKDADAESMSKDDLDKVVAHLVFIEHGARRCTEIVESLLRFSRTSRCASTEVDVNELIEETLGFTSRELSSRGIELKSDLVDGELQVIGDPRQLQQVFANIILNARKAMLSGGRLSVSSARVPAENGGGESVAVSFGDTGSGISGENLLRVFEPFFTTSEVGEGSGLGLSVSYGIIKDHGGKIDVESKVGVGSTFTVLLPVAGSGGGENPCEGRA